MHSVQVVIPTYNRAAQVCEAILSVMRNTMTYGDLGVVVVDDGSTDDTNRRLKSLQTFFGARLAIVYTEHSGRPGVARNIGVQHSTAELLTFLDSDDTMPSGRINEQYGEWGPAYERGFDIVVGCEMPVLKAPVPWFVGPEAECSHPYVMSMMGLREVFVHYPFPEDYEILDDIVWANRNIRPSRLKMWQTHHVWTNRVFHGKNLTYDRKTVDAEYHRMMEEMRALHGC